GDLFAAKGVQLVLYGHRHQYEHRLINGVHYVAGAPAGGSLPAPWGEGGAYAIGDQTGIAQASGGFTPQGQSQENMAVNGHTLVNPNKIQMPWWGYLRVDVQGDTLAVKAKMAANFNEITAGCGTKGCSDHAPVNMDIFTTQYSVKAPTAPK